jgi:hypothetical protein
MKVNLAILLLILFISLPIQAQVFDGEWTCDYATIDDQPNATGYNTPSVGVVSANTFVALVRRGVLTSGTGNLTCYLVGYANADSINGRLGDYPYGTSGVGGYNQPWISGFEQVEMVEALDIEASPSDSLIYVANNDPESSILVFKLTPDSVISADYRMISGADSLWAIDLDASGRVYVSSIKDSVTPSQILVFGSVMDEPEWGLPSHSATPLTTITMPEPGEIRGVTVNPEGTIVYASNFKTKKIYCFIGSPTSGYTLYNGFNFTLNDDYTGSDLVIYSPGPWGLNFMPTKNLLLVSCSVNYSEPGGYNAVTSEYGRLYILNPNTGAVLDTIDVAAWNLMMNGAYDTRVDQNGRASGYASTYNIVSDENFDLYNVSYYSWTVDKWSYSGTLPTIPITIVGIEKDEFTIPSEFTLKQNFPNPFNPSTTIEFSLLENSEISLLVYSITGEFITDLVKNTLFEKGNYKVTFDASKLASGTYIYSLTSGGKVLSKKMTLIK